MFEPARAASLPPRAGRRTAEIARELNLSTRTVESHRQALMQILNVRSGITLIREAERLGLINT